MIRNSGFKREFLNLSKVEGIRTLNTNPFLILYKVKHFKLC